MIPVDRLRQSSSDGSIGIDLALWVALQIVGLFQEKSANLAMLKPDERSAHATGSSPTRLGVRSIFRCHPAAAHCGGARGELGRRRIHSDDV